MWQALWPELALLEIERSVVAIMSLCCVFILRARIVASLGEQKRVAADRDNRTS